MKAHSPSMLLLAMIAFGSTPVLAQNLIANGTFDTDYLGWSGSAAWAADDCCGNSASGSVKTFEFDALNSNCMQVTGGSPYDLTLWSKFSPTGIPPAASNGLAQVVWASDNACATAINFPDFPYMALGNNAGWQHAGATFVAPVTAHSVYIRILSSVCGLSCGGYTFFDDVAFGPPGTVPVELQSFEID